VNLPIRFDCFGKLPNRIDIRVFSLKKSAVSAYCLFGTVARELVKSCRGKYNGTIFFVRIRNNKVGIRPDDQIRKTLIQRWRWFGVGDLLHNLQVLRPFLDPFVILWM